MDCLLALNLEPIQRWVQHTLNKASSVGTIFPKFLRRVPAVKYPPWQCFSGLEVRPVLFTYRDCPKSRGKGRKGKGRLEGGPVPEPLARIAEGVLLREKVQQVEGRGGELRATNEMLRTCELSLQLTSS